MKRKSQRNVKRSYSDIKHCKSCKDGRLVEHSGMIFCGFCGKEFKK